MRYAATYKDDRDPDESAIGEFDSVDEAVDGVVKYFRQVPDAIFHAEFYRVTELGNPTNEFVFDTKIIF